MDLTTREASSRLGVNVSRVRALIASGGLRARRVGNQWLIDADSVSAQQRLIEGRATGRALSQRTAWATAALIDGHKPEWVSASERARIRRRVLRVASPEVLQRWLTRRADQVHTYRGDVEGMTGLLATPGVVVTGVSATAAYGIGLTVIGHGDAYVSRPVRDMLVRSHSLIETSQGHVTLRVVDHDWHLRTAREDQGHTVAARLAVGVDLADDADVRTRQLGLWFIAAVLEDLR
jgi:excisionase family DNA binding protein